MIAKVMSKQWVRWNIIAVVLDSNAILKYKGNHYGINKTFLKGFPRRKKIQKNGSLTNKKQNTRDGKHYWIQSLKSSRRYLPKESNPEMECVT